MAKNGSETSREFKGNTYFEHHVHPKETTDLGLFGLAVREFLHVAEQRMTGSPITIQTKNGMEEIIFADTPKSHSDGHPPCNGMTVTAVLRKSR